MTKADAVTSNEFDKRFPILMQELEKLGLTTGLWDIRKQIMFLEDDAADELIDQFYKVKMLNILEAINVEVTSVIGQAWSILCQ